MTIISKPASKDYLDNFDHIFRSKTKKYLCLDCGWSGDVLGVKETDSGDVECCMHCDSDKINNIKFATPNHLLHDSEDDKFPDEPKPTNTQK